MRLTRWMFAALLAASLAARGARRRQLLHDPNDNDQTLHAMRDEMARAKIAFVAEHSRPDAAGHPVLH